MRFKILSQIALSITIAALLTGGPASAQSQVVKLDGPDIQVVLDQLFGTPTSDGLLEGTKHFELRAENIVLTQEQAEMFFAPSPTNKFDFTDLVAAAKLLKGIVVRIEGKLDDAPFEFQMSGKQLKAEGLVLTQAEFDALVNQLKGTPGLHEAKIEATVDGELLIAKLQNVPGKVKIEHHGFVEGPTPTPTPTPHIEVRSGKVKSDARLAVTDRAEHSEHSGVPGKVEKLERAEKVERFERPEKVERIERPEKVERVERPVKIERIERPEVAQSGKGRG